MCKIQTHTQAFLNRQIDAVSKHLGSQNTDQGTEFNLQYFPPGVTLISVTSLVKAEKIWRRTKYYSVKGKISRPYSDYTVLIKQVKPTLVVSKSLTLHHSVKYSGSSCNKLLAYNVQATFKIK